MIDYDKDQGWLVTCDRCGHQVTISSAAIKLERALCAVATGQGWQIAERIALRKQGDDLCPECAAMVRKPEDGWECMHCGATFNEPAHEWGRDEPEPYEYDVCPECGSTIIQELTALDDPPLSCPQCGSERQWQCIGEVAQPSGAWHWAYRCMACDFESSYAGHPDAT